MGHCTSCGNVLEDQCATCHAGCAHAKDWASIWHLDHVVHVHPGAHFEMEPSDEGRMLSCGVGWHPRALPLRLMCILFGRNGEKLADLGTNATPFHRSGIRYINAPAAAIQRPQAPSSQKAFIGADVVRLNFMPQNFEPHVGGICLALRTAVGHHKQAANQGSEDFHAHARLSIVDSSDNESDMYALCEVNGKTCPSENQSLILAVISRGLDHIWRFEAVDQCVRTSCLDKGVQQVTEHLGFHRPPIAGGSSNPAVATKIRAQLDDKLQRVPPLAYKRSVQHIHAQAPTPSLLHGELKDWLAPPEHSVAAGGLEIFIEDGDDTDTSPDIDPFAQALGTPKTGCKSTELDAHVPHRVGERRHKTSL